MAAPRLLRSDKIQCPSHFVFLTIVRSLGEAHSPPAGGPTNQPIASPRMLKIHFRNCTRIKRNYDADLRK